MYGSARGRQILLYKITPNPNPNTNTNPSSPYCIMRFIFGSRVHVPLCDLEVCVQGSTFLVAAGMVVSTVAVGSKGGKEIVVRQVGDRA